MKFNIVIQSKPKILQLVSPSIFQDLFLLSGLFQRLFLCFKFSLSGIGMCCSLLAFLSFFNTLCKIYYSFTIRIKVSLFFGYFSVWWYSIAVAKKVLKTYMPNLINYFDYWERGGIQLGPLGTSAINWPIVPALGDYEDGEFGRGKLKHSEKTCPSATLSTTNPTWPDRARTQAAAVGSQQLTAWTVARPYVQLNSHFVKHWITTSRLLQGPTRLLI
jgi:hypothetical protein